MGGTKKEKAGINPISVRLFLWGGTEKMNIEHPPAMHRALSWRHHKFVNLMV
jgi:hypothetical protein